MAANIKESLSTQAGSSASAVAIPARTAAGDAAHTDRRTPTSTKLSILVPVYNERYTVGALLERVRAAALPAGVGREIIAVDDASTDGTRAVLEQACERYPDVMRLHRHASNRGKGAAIRTAIAAATGDICVIQDADLEYDPADYSALLDPILSGEADVVYGSRFAARARRRVLYFWHSLANRFLTTLSNLCTNLNLTDMETCYKAVRTDILKSIPLRSDRFGIEPELTAKLAKRGCRMYEVPISYDGRTYGEGKKIGWRDGVKALFTILYYWIVDDVYDEKYGHAILHRLSATHRFNRWMAAQIQPWVGDRVLEIGAGLGNLSTKLMPREHYTLSDIDPLHLRYLRSHFGPRPYAAVAHVELQNADDFRALDRRFDTVVCLNVLEHVEDDDRALCNMHDALVPGGRALILVPRGQWLFGSLDQVLDHFRRYSRDELAGKCGRAGLEIESLFTFNRVSVLPWFVNGRLMRRKHFGKLQLKLFDSLVWLWRRIDRLMPWPGLSLIAIARKPLNANGVGADDSPDSRFVAEESSLAPANR